MNDERGPKQTPTQPQTAPKHPTPHDPKILRYISSLMAHNYRQLGFLSWAAIEEYNARGGITLSYENDEPCGYCIFDNRTKRKATRNEPHSISIRQCVIQDDARRIYHGSHLVNQLALRATLAGYHNVNLWCANDLPACKFWYALGFEHIRTRIGGSARGRIHYGYSLNLDTIVPNELPEPPTVPGR